MLVAFFFSPHLLSSYVFDHDRLAQQDSQYAKVKGELNNFDLCFLRIQFRIKLRVYFTRNLRK